MPVIRLGPAGWFPHNTPLTDMQGKFAEAEPVYEQSQAMLENVLGPEHPDVGAVLNNRAALLVDQVRDDNIFIYSIAPGALECAWGP